MILLTLPAVILLSSMYDIEIRSGQLRAGFELVRDELSRDAEHEVIQQLRVLQRKIVVLREEYQRSADYPRFGTDLPILGREPSEGQSRFAAGETQAVRRTIESLPLETQRKLLYGIVRSKIRNGGLLEFAATIEAQLLSENRETIQSKFRQELRPTYDHAAVAVATACENYNKQVHNAIPQVARLILDQRLGFSSSSLFDGHPTGSSQDWPALPKTNMLRSIRAFDEPLLSPRVVFGEVKYGLSSSGIVNFFGSATDDWTAPPSARYVRFFEFLAATTSFLPRVAPELEATLEAIETQLQSADITGESERAQVLRKRLLFVQDKLRQWERNELEFTPSDIDFLLFGSRWAGIDRLPLHAAEFKTISSTPLKRVDGRAIADLTFTTADPLGLGTSLYEMEYSPEQNRFVSEKWRQYRLAMDQATSVRERLDLTKELLLGFAETLTPRQLSQIFVHVVRSRGLLYFFSHPVVAKEYGVDREHFFALASAAEQELARSLHEQKLTIVTKTWEQLSAETRQEILNRTDMAEAELLEFAAQTPWETFRFRRE